MSSRIITILALLFLVASSTGNSDYYGELANAQVLNQKVFL